LRHVISTTLRFSNFISRSLFIYFFAEPTRTGQSLPQGRAGGGQDPRGEEGDRERRTTRPQAPPRGGRAVLDGVEHPANPVRDARYSCVLIIWYIWREKKKSYASEWFLVFGFWFLGFFFFFCFVFLGFFFLFCFEGFFFFFFFGIF
jgi:hypothetical protein